jgi:hypothetical protein
VDRGIAGLRDILETRLEAMDKAIELVGISAKDGPKLTHELVANLQELHEEKFASIATQFTERDKRTEQLSIADKTAIAAALQAQKEAAGAQNESNTTASNKMEANFAAQISTISTLIAAQGKSADDKNEGIKTLYMAQSKATDDKLSALEKRLDLNDGRTKGAGDVWGYVIAIIMAIIAAGALSVMLVKK